MICRFREEIDLARYLTDPSASEFEAFRAHYPDCAVCSAELALWTGIESTLAEPSQAEGADDGPWHPDVEALARYAGGGATAGPEQMKMQRHLDACATCRTEWQALQTFDFAEVVGAPWGAAAEAPAAAAPSAIERIAGWLGLDRPPRWAAAGALLVAIAAIGTWVTIGEGGGGARAPQRLAERSAPTAEPEPSAIPPQPVPVPAPSDPSRLAAADRAAVPEPVLSESAAPAPAPTPSIEPEVVQLAEAQGGPGGAAVPAIDRDEEPSARDAAPAGDLVAGEEILLASLSQMAPPDYAAPSGSTELAWMHQFGSVRGVRGDGSAPRVTAHAPDHVGLTREASPRLWWSVSEPTEQAIVVTVVDDREIDPVLELTLAGPHAAGLASISLADEGVSLEPGIEYRWFVTLVNDPDRPSRNPVSAGSIKRLASNDAETNAIDEVGLAERGHELARRGYWYDSYDFFATLETRHPEVAALGDHRVKLLAAGGAAN